MKCPDCGTEMSTVDPRHGRGEEDRRWYCPVALEAKRRGLLGEPGRKHKEAWIYGENPAK